MIYENWKDLLLNVDCTMKDAIEVLEFKKHGIVIVVDGDHKVVGMLHQRAIIRRIAERGIHSWDGKVSEVSIPSKDIVYVRPSDTVENVS